jgi:hypothetical protein
MRLKKKLHNIVADLCLPHNLLCNYVDHKHSKLDQDGLSKNPHEKLRKLN